MKTSKYAITGIGYIASTGTGYNSFVNNIKNKIQTSIIENCDPEGYLGAKGIRYFNKATKLYCNLAFQCLEQNDLKLFAESNPDRIGLYDGSELSNLYDGFIFDLVAKTEGPDLVSPMSAPNTIANAASSQMAIKSKITGPNFSVSGGACGALQALDIATLHLNNHIIDHAIISSTEIITQYQKAVRKGENRITVFNESSEQGVALTVETKEVAEKSNKKVYATLSECVSGQKLKNEHIEDTIIRLISNLSRENPSSFFDAIIIGGGGQNINAIRLDALLNKTECLKDKPVYYPEFIYGNGDNTGGFLGILYSIAIFNREINPICEFKHGELTTIPSENKNNLSDILVVTADKTGYCSLLIVSKK